MDRISLGYRRSSVAWTEYAVIGFQEGCDRMMVGAAREIYDIVGASGCEEVDCLLWVAVFAK